MRAWASSFQRAPLRSNSQTAASLPPGFYASCFVEDSDIPNPIDCAKSANLETEIASLAVYMLMNGFWHIALSRA